MRSKATRLGKILVRYGKITDQQLDKAVHVCMNRKAANMRHSRIGIILVEMCFCSREDVSWAIGLQKRLRACKTSRSEKAFEEALGALVEMKAAFVNSA